MQIQCRSQSGFNKETCYIIGVFSDHSLTPLGKTLPSLAQQALKPLITDPFFLKASDRCLYLPFVPHFPGQLLLVFCGHLSEVHSVFAYQSLLDNLAKALQTIYTRFIYFDLTCLAVKNKTQDFLFFEAGHKLSQAFYRCDALKTVKPSGIKTPVLLLPKLAQKSVSLLTQLRIFISALKLVKDLGNLPANVCTPVYLAQEARKITRLFAKKLSVKIFGKAALQKMGMHTLLTVSKGSFHAPQLICLHYNPAYKSGRKKQKPIIFIGKGITFDSGGLCLKPSAAMDEMKYDMCGAATVLGLMHAVAAAQLKIPVIGLIPAAENLVDAKATQPGDIVKSFSGKTIEILNTDAEGRLILCDVLSYAERFSPQAVIDIATLTGAALMTFGHVTHALMGNDTALIQDLLKASENCGERTWELPLWEEYQAMLQSRFADIPNIHDSPHAKTIIGGCFLSRFAHPYPWAHLDIAGTAWVSGKNKGATGRPLLLLLTYLWGLAQKNGL